MWLLRVKFSSINTPRDLVKLTLFYCVPLISKPGRTDRLFNFCLDPINRYKWRSGMMIRLKWSSKDKNTYLKLHECHEWSWIKELIQDTWEITFCSSHNCHLFHNNKNLCLIFGWNVSAIRFIIEEVYHEVSTRTNDDVATCHVECGRIWARGIGNVTWQPEKRWSISLW